MAVVVSKKSKLCIFSLFVLVVVGIGLAVVSTLGLLENKERSQVATAEKLSQWKSEPKIVDKVSML